jgi:hypothetical protein
MPYYSINDGTKFYKDDICTGCEHMLQCNVFSDLRIEQTQSKWDETHIVEVGNGNGRDGYHECQSYRPYTKPAQREDQDPQFGERLSQQVYNRTHGLPIDTPQRLRS